MIKTKKGQIIILDVLFAVVIVVLMFFLLVKLAEIEIYNVNSDKSIEKLNYSGMQAYRKIINNPQVNAKVVDSKNSVYIPGSVNKFSSITKSKLSISWDYNCYFSVNSVAFPINECNQTPPTDKETFAVDFNVIVFTSDITKEEYINYVTGRETPVIETATLKVWRSV